MTVTTLVNAPDIDLEASIGPLGVFVRNGHVRLDNGTAGQAATWTVGAGRRAPATGTTLTDLIGNPGSVVQTNVAGRFEVDLPVAFPNADEPQGNIHLTVGDLSDIAGTTDLDEAACPTSPRPSATST